ncbi:MAG TPA: sodium/sugar symporter [Bacteroidales bacterium]|nr:sodium/sugar symporter [Bacteroidales bacterium]
MHFATIDFIVFIIYCLVVVGLGLWISTRKKSIETNSGDYFLAGRALPWWAIGASLIASNISAEQFIGMSGSGFAIGLAIASYEWMAALTILIVAYFFLPIFLEKKIYTMPQFLEVRFNKKVKTVMAIFWLVVFIFVNLTSIIYLGALALERIMGVPMIYGILGLAAFAALYSLYGGLKAVAWTDVIQVFFLVGGGLVTTYFALNHLSGGEGVMAGFAELIRVAPEKFDMILERGDKMIPDGQGGFRDAYLDLPGISVLIGGMWVANLYYWGCNQYIIQRALAAKSIREAQHGLAFAAFLKLLLPLIVVIPGIAAFALNADIARSDEAYPWLLQTFVPSGLRGLAFAALVAAIVSSLASMINSIATIFTMDIYREFFHKAASERALVRTGRIAAAAALLIAVMVAPTLRNLDMVFMYIQEFTGFVSPGALAIFIAGFFYKKATPNGALAAAIGTFVFSLLFKALMPDLPFIDRMGIVFLMCMGLIVVFAYIEGNVTNPKAIILHKGLFGSSKLFLVASAVVVIILVILYAVFW